MLSLVDLRDFAEICRAIEEYTASVRRIEGPVGPHHRTGSRSRGHDDAWAADSGGPAHRFYRKAGGLE